MNQHKMSQNFARYLHNTVWRSQERLEYMLKLLFQGLPLDNRSVLEIGAGSGLLSAWCALNGATEVVALEPEADGSTKGINQEFRKLTEAVDLKERCRYLPITFEQYLTKNKSKSFDYLLMFAVINHLNEDATKKLHLTFANAERQCYIDIFMNLYSILKPGGVLLVYDVGMRNFWNDLRLKNRLTLGIEYNKHQQPIIWKRLLEQSGFELMDITWVVPVRLRKLAPFLSWWLPAYLTQSGFILRCKKR